LCLTVFSVELSTIRGCTSLIEYYDHFTPNQSKEQFRDAVSQCAEIAFVEDDNGFADTEATCTGWCRVFDDGNV
jgi:hypothetical protein